MESGEQKQDIPHRTAYKIFKYLISVSRYGKVQNVQDDEWSIYNIDSLLKQYQLVQLYGSFSAPSSSLTQISYDVEFDDGSNEECKP